MPATAREFVHAAARRFESAGLYYGHGTDNPHDEAVYLVFRALGLPFDVAESRLDELLDAEQRRRLEALIRDRIETRRPVAYLLNEAWFAGRPYYVDERVLIPRSPIAELIADGFSPWLSAPPARILDLCTGSGCIAIAAAHQFPAGRVDAADLSAEALAVARINVDRHGLAARVTLHESDLFEALGDARYDLIVSNPPYVPQTSLQALPEEYRHEPALGLRAGDDGLVIVDRILAQACGHLSTSGLLVVEVGESQPAVEKKYPGLPLTWLEFTRGGEGVFLINARELAEAGYAGGM